MFTDRSITAKAARYLTSGAVTITEANDTSGIVVATVTGDSGTWTVFRPSAATPWLCTCPAGARGRPCAHQSAVALVAG
jgi:uncharacterized Zn finger protein